MLGIYNDRSNVANAKMTMSQWGRARQSVDENVKLKMKKKKVKEKKKIKCSGKAAHTSYNYAG